METLGIIYAIVTVLAWGTWLAPSEKVELPNALARAFYIAVGNLLLASVVFLVVGGAGQLTGDAFLYPFVGGLIWALGALCAFSGIARIGMAKAFGVWAPLNIIVGIVWGILLWGEFLNASTRTILLAVVAVLVIIVGILMIVFSGGTGETKEDKKALMVGFGGAIGAGVLWGTFFVPSAYFGKDIQASGWVTAFPLALGMIVGSGILCALSGKAPKCQSKGDYARVVSSGMLWSVGNFAMLLMVGVIGMGKGFTIAQMCVVVNSLVGVFIIREPAPGTRAAKLTLFGVVVATLGGILLGNLKDAPAGADAITPEAAVEQTDAEASP
jgi:glucose uptake protein